ncbi:solute carrier family 22 member 11 [Dugong dugon]
MAFAELLERTGGMGLFQALQILTFFLPSILLPPQLLLENFSAANPGHRCWTPMLDNSSEVPANLSLEALLTISIPTDPQHGPSQCHRFRHPQWQLLEPNATATNWSKATTEPCMDGWVYDHSTFTSTIITEWDLVCHSQHLKPMSQSIYMTGILLGSTTWGLLSDRFGRKPMLIWCCLQVAVTSTSTIFAPNFLIYCGLRFMSAFALGGIIMTSSMLMVEWTPTPRRAVAMTILGCFYSLGQMALGGLAFALRDWWTLQLVVSVPFFAIFLANWWLPESARWLIIMGKPDKGLQELKKVARINGNKEAKKTLTIEVLMSSMQEELASAKTRQSWLDLFHMPKLRWRLLGLLVVIFSVTFSYYGLVLDLQNLGSDIFLLQVLFGAIDFLGRATTPFLLKFFGRRFTIASSQSTAGFFILANVLVPQDFQTLRVVFAVLGKGCFGVTLTCLAVYRTELFPTSLRMTADGLLQSAGRLGAVMGPLIRMTRQALPLLPPLSYGIVPIASSLLLLLLPETQGLPLPDTVQNLESQ